MEGLSVEGLPRRVIKVIFLPLSIPQVHFFPFHPLFLSFAPQIAGGSRTPLLHKDASVISNHGNEVSSQSLELVLVKRVKTQRVLSNCSLLLLEHTEREKMDFSML